jgi:Flp pilus assembly pilin Flp
MRTFLERLFDDKTGPTAIAVVTIAGLNAIATDVGS